MDVRWGRRGVPPLRGVEDAAPYTLFFAGAGHPRPLRSHFYFVIHLPVQRFPRKHAVFQRHIPVGAVFLGDGGGAGVEVIVIIAERLPCGHVGMTVQQDIPRLQWRQVRGVVRQLYKRIRGLVRKLPYKS